MPRFTPSRVLKIIFLPWLTMLGLWLFLPSPTIKSTFRSRHIQNALHAGRKLITVHEWHESFAGRLTERYSHVPSPSDGCKGLIINWQLLPQPKHNSMSLRIANDLTLNLTDSLQHTYIDKSGYFIPYLSEVYHARADLGDEDHYINLPWFQWPDQTLFHNHMHGFDYNIAVRVRVPEKGRVEIWKDLPCLSGLPAELPRDSDREFGILASFSNLTTGKGAASSVSHINIGDVKGRLPSRTYSTRMFILGYMAPLFSMVPFIIIYFVIPFLLRLIPYAAICAVVAFLFWLWDGRPDFSDWWDTFWMTRWLSRKRHKRTERQVRIWGPQGPIFEDDDDQQEEFDPWSQHPAAHIAGRFKVALSRKPGTYSREKRSEID